MKTADDFIPHMEVLLPGVPRPLLLRALADSAALFCERTRVLQVTVRTDIIAEEAVYELDLPRQTNLVAVLQAKVGGCWLKVSTPAQQLSISAAEEDSPEMGAPREIVGLTGASVQLNPVPQHDMDDALLVRAAVKPQRGATTFEDVLYDDWLEAVVHGAVATLAAHPMQSYSNPEQAALSGGIFAAEIARAKRVALQGKTNGHTRVVPRPLVR